MQVRPGDGLADLEVGRERRAHGGERMDVLSEHFEYPVPVEVVIDGAERPALGDPPVDRAVVVAGDVEFVDDQPSAGRDQRGQMGAGLIQRLDVMKRDHGDGGVERSACLKQRDPLDIRAGVLGRIDRGHVPAGAAQLAGELSAARADLEDPRRRLGQRRPDEREQIGSEHRRMIAKDAPRRRPGRR